MKFRVLFLLGSAVLAADKVPVSRLIEMSRQNPAPAGFRDVVAATLGEAEIQKGTAVLGEGPDFFWAVESTVQPLLIVDEQPPWTMKRIKATDTWYLAEHLTPGTSHMFHYVIGGGPFGGKNDVAAYLPESYAHADVPQGKLSDRIVHTSKIYPGMETNYWIYVPAQYDAKTAAALMVWQDGEGHINREGSAHTLNVIDNLIYEKKIPPTIQVFISPGVVGDKKMRSIEYDTVDDTYDRFLRDEILADVGKQYNLRQDSYSRAIAGNSSGGICSFNAAWFHPELFSRVLSRIGSFTSIQWHPGVIEGGNVYPFKIRKEAKRNIRVWLQDGSNDLENEHGSWPLQNLEMANSLKRQGYDFHLSFGTGTHNGAHGNSEAPVELTWLWRDYDSSKTEQVYEMEAVEASRGLFRVKVMDR